MSLVAMYHDWRRGEEALVNLRAGLITLLVDELKRRNEMDEGRYKDAGHSDKQLAEKLVNDPIMGRLQTAIHTLQEARDNAVESYFRITGERRKFDDAGASQADRVVRGNLFAMAERVQILSGQIAEMTTGLAVLM